MVRCKSERCHDRSEGDVGVVLRETLAERGLVGDVPRPRPVDVGEIRYGAPAGTLPPSLSASARQQTDRWLIERYVRYMTSRRRTPA